MNITEIILSVQFSVKLHSKIKQGYLDNQSRSMQLTIVFCRDQTESVHEWKWMANIFLIPMFTSLRKKPCWLCNTCILFS